MTTETHRQIANDIWSICNLLRGPYKRNEYRKVILPLTVLRRFDGLLAPTKAKPLETFNQYKSKPESIVRSVMQSATGYPFYNLSKLEFRPSQKGINSLLDDPGHLAQNLNSYINAFSPNVRAIMERFGFDQQIARMAEKNLLFKVVQKFATFDLSFPNLAADQVAMQMGYVFEELFRIGAEQSNEEAGEHFTPREVIKLMVNLLLSPEQDLRRSHVVKTIYDPACGTGGMLSVAEKYIRDLNSDAKPLLYGQDWNDEAWAVCRSDMLIKGEDADNIARGDTEALEELNLKPDLVVGASGGALVGVLWASGCNARELETLALDLNPVRLARVVIGSSERLSGSALADLVREHARQPLLERLPTMAVCVAQRLGARTGPATTSGRGSATSSAASSAASPKTGSGADDRSPLMGFCRGDVGLAVQAACAIEGQFAPVLIHGQPYADADLVMPLPVRLARGLGAQRVLAVDASAHEKRAPPGSERWRAGDLQKRALTEPDTRAADLVLHPEFGYYVSFSREFRERCIAAGYRDTLVAAQALHALHAA